MARQFIAAIRSKLIPKLHLFAKQEDSRTDATEEDVQNEAFKFARAAFATSAINGAASTVAQRISKHSKGEFERIGISLKDEPGLGKLIRTWRRGLVDRVKSVEQDQLGKLHTILKEGAGLRAEQLAKKIDWELEVTARQAMSIARNQVVMLNSQITESRMQAAGIQEYIWTTAGNEKVSEAHAELEGERFSFDDPPEDADGNVGNPGLIRPNCQCQAYPILEALEE